MLARKIIESLNVSPIYFIVAFNLSQNLSLIAGICIYDCKPIHLVTSNEKEFCRVDNLTIENWRK
jgi:predicted nucleic acid-binding protein